MANKYVKNSSTHLTIKELQIKITLRFHLTLVRLAIIKQHKKQQMLVRTWKKQTFTHLWWESKLLQAVLRLHKKTKNRPTTQSSKTTSGHISK
jgi:hypothetical protein